MNILLFSGIFCYICRDCFRCVHWSYILYGWLSAVHLQRLIYHCGLVAVFWNI